MVNKNSLKNLEQGKAKPFSSNNQPSPESKRGSKKINIKKEFNRI